jgi:hypothetical protein
VERISIADLRRLASLAEDDERELFERRPEGAGRCKGRLLCRALCQGAALHCLNGRNGVKDFDVWSFYVALDDGARRIRIGATCRSTSGPRSLGDGLVTGLGSRAVGSICWGGLCPRRWMMIPQLSSTNTSVLVGRTRREHLLGSRSS